MTQSRLQELTHALSGLITVLNQRLGVLTLVGKITSVISGLTCRASKCVLMRVPHSSKEGKESMDADIPSLVQLTANLVDSDVYLPHKSPAPRLSHASTTLPAPRTLPCAGPCPAGQSRVALTLKLPLFTQRNASS